MSSCLLSERRWQSYAAEWMISALVCVAIERPCRTNGSSEFVELAAPRLRRHRGRPPLLANQCGRFSGENGTTDEHNESAIRDSVSSCSAADTQRKKYSSSLE
jgi:hypothetical protein